LEQGSSDSVLEGDRAHLSDDDAQFPKCHAAAASVGIPLALFQYLGYLLEISTGS